MKRMGVSLRGRALGLRPEPPKARRLGHSAFIADAAFGLSEPVRQPALLPALWWRGLAVVVPCRGDESRVRGPRGDRDGKIAGERFRSGPSWKTP
jgi:hypothetical protein